MAESRSRLDWLRVSTATARVLNAFAHRGRGVRDDWLVPPGLRDGLVAEKGPEPPKLPVDVLVNIFVKGNPKVA